MAFSSVFAPNIKTKSRNLGVIFNPQLKFDYHLHKLVKSCFFNLRNIAKIRPLLFFDLEHIIQAFFLS